MAIAFRTSANGGGTSGTSDRTASISALTGDLLVVCVAVTTNTNIAPTCSDDAGGTYTIIEHAYWNASASSCAMFVRDSLVGSNATIVVTAATGSNDSGSVVITAWTGSVRAGRQILSQSAFDSNQSATATGTVTLPRSVTGSGYPVICMLVSDDTTTTPPSGYTETQDTSQATPGVALEVAYIIAPSSNVVTWGAAQASGVQIAAIAVELSGDGAAIDTTRPQLQSWGGMARTTAQDTPVSVPWPADLASGDIGILVVANYTSLVATPAITLTTASGFTLIGSRSLQNYLISAYWCRSTGTSMTAPQVESDTGSSELVARIFTVRRLVAAGTPVDNYQVGTPKDGIIVLGNRRYYLACGFGNHVQQWTSAATAFGNTWFPGTEGANSGMGVSQSWNTGNINSTATRANGIETQPGIILSLIPAGNSFRPVGSRIVGLNINPTVVPTAVRRSLNGC